MDKIMDEIEKKRLDIIEKKKLDRALKRCEYSKKYYEKNRETYLQRAKQFYNENPEYFQKKYQNRKDKNKEYYQKNKERIIVNVKKYHESNSLEIKKKQKEWRTNNPDKVKAQYERALADPDYKQKKHQQYIKHKETYKAYYEANKEKILENHKNNIYNTNIERSKANREKWKKNNPDKVKQYSKNAYINKMAEEKSKTKIMGSILSFCEVENEILTVGKEKSPE